MNDFDTLAYSVVILFFAMVYINGFAEAKEQDRRNKHLRSLKIGSTVLATDEYFLFAEGIVTKFVPYEVKQVSVGFLNSGRVYQPEGFMVKISDQEYFFRPEQLTLKKEV